MSNYVSNNMLYCPTTRITRTEFLCLSLGLLNLPRRSFDEGERAKSWKAWAKLREPSGQVSMPNPSCWSKAHWP